MPRKSVVIVAGEASGDLLGANLVEELRQQQPDLVFTGMGGKRMHQAGVKILVDNQALDIIGWWEVLKNLAKIRVALRTIRHELKHNRPDLLILIDYPGFNLRMAKVAKKMGIKVFYYVSPQIWAWRYRRIKVIKRCVDHMAVLFPFEVQIYRQEQVPATYVGHPLTKLVQVTQSKDSIYQQYHLDPSRAIIALFPGSRRQEIQRLLPVITAAIPLIRHHVPQAQFILPLASSLRAEDLQSYLTDEITIIENNTYNLLSVCDAAIVKSGTATLEVALSQVPLVIIYKGQWLNYWIARMVVKVKQIGLCNIVAQKSIAKEFIQHQVTPHAIANEIARLLQDTKYRQQMLQDLAAMKANFGQHQSSSAAAKIVLQMIGV